MREKYDTDMGNLNRVFISIMDGWDDADQVLEQILKQ